MDLFVPRRTRYANTPFEVDEVRSYRQLAFDALSLGQCDDSDEELDCYSSYDGHSEHSHLTLGSLHSVLSDQSYLILDFEDGEFSPCNTEHGYGITHPDEQLNIHYSVDGPQEVYDSESAKNTWYDDAEDEDDESYVSDYYYNSSSLSVDQPSLTLSTSNISSSGEETDELPTPTSVSDDGKADLLDEEQERKPSVEQDRAAIAELRSTLKRHLPPSASGSAYFEMLVADALSSLDEALREAPSSCFEEMCWDAQCSSPPVDAIDYDFSVSGLCFLSRIQANTNFQTQSRRKSRQTVQFIDVPEEVQAPLEWEWRENDAYNYKYSIPSPSQDIGFSPRAIVKPQPSSGSFRKLARRFRAPREAAVY